VQILAGDESLRWNHLSTDLAKLAIKLEELGLIYDGECIVFAEEVKYV
jgi:hypothetical protein